MQKSQFEVLCTGLFNLLRLDNAKDHVSGFAGPALKKNMHEALKDWTKMLSILLRLG